MGVKIKGFTQDQLDKFYEIARDGGLPGVKVEEEEGDNEVRMAVESSEYGTVQVQRYSEKEDWIETPVVGSADSIKLNG